MRKAESRSKTDPIRGRSRLEPTSIRLSLRGVLGLPRRLSPPQLQPRAADGMRSVAIGSPNQRSTIGQQQLRCERPSSQARDVDARNASVDCGQVDPRHELTGRPDEACRVEVERVDGRSICR